MTRRRVLLSQRAQWRVDDIWEQRKEARREAGRLLAELASLFDSLAEFPDMGRAWGEGQRSTVVRSYRTRHRVIWALAGDAVLVLRVVDCRAAAKLARTVQRRED